MPQAVHLRLDPHGIAARLLRILTGLAVFAGFYSGATVSAKVADLTRAQLDAALTEEAGPVSQMVRTLEYAMMSGQAEPAEALVDRAIILARATGSVQFDGDAEVRQLFCDSTERAWNERGVMRDFKGTKFRFLHTRELGGRPGLLFRSTNSQGAVNFVLFTVSEARPGEFRITDMFVVGLNEFLSDTLCRTWLNVAAGFLAEDEGELEGVNPEYVKHIGEVAQASRLLNAGKFEEALKVTKSLPLSVQRERSVLLVRIEAADRISTSERRAAFAAWLEVYPDEQELPLKLVEFYSSQRRYSDAERVLRDLMDRIGPDLQLKRELGSILFRQEHDKSVVARAALKVE